MIAAPFTYLSPPAVLGGRGSAEQLATRVATQLPAHAAVLFAADRALVERGLIAPIEDALIAAELSPVVLTDFGPELTAEQIDAAVAAGRAAHCQGVVGVGGGSILDAAKMAALLLEQGGVTADWIGQLAPALRRAPLTLVPTTIGTGAEVTRVSMVTIAGQKKITAGDTLIPDVAVLDPRFVDGLPAGVVGATGMDALAHAAESIMSSARSPMTELLAFHAIDLICANLPAAYAGQVPAREQMLWAAHLAGLSLNAGVVLGHSLAYSVARITPMPHGTSCALALPYTLAFNQRLDDDLAHRLAGALTRGRSNRMRDAATAVRELAERVGQPTNLTAAGLPDGAEQELAQICVKDYPRPTNPEPITLEHVTALIEAMRSGDLTAAFTITSTDGDSENDDR